MNTNNQEQENLLEVCKDVCTLFPEATTIEVHYSGEGDDGGIESVYFFNAAGELAPTTAERKKAKDIIEDWADDLLLAHYSAWYDGDGARGTIHLSPQNRKATIQHEWREYNYNPADEIEIEAGDPPSVGPMDFLSAVLD